MSKTFNVKIANFWLQNVNEVEHRRSVDLAVKLLNLVPQIVTGSLQSFTILRRNHHSVTSCIETFLKDCEKSLFERVENYSRKFNTMVNNIILSGSYDH